MQYTSDSVTNSLCDNCFVICENNSHMYRLVICNQMPCLLTSNTDTDLKVFVYQTVYLQYWVKLFDAEGISVHSYNHSINMK